MLKKRSTIPMILYDNFFLGHPMVGDGLCNDETNNADCSYDGGDCCGACVVKDHCSECACLGGADGMNVLIGNKFCNDETNNAECYYDGGDCCGYEINYDHCSVCTCFHQQMCASGFNGRVIVFLSYKLKLSNGSIT